MGEWEEGPATFDRTIEGWGSVSAGFEGEGAGAEGGGQEYLELIGSRLRVAGMVDLGRFRRVSDFVNLILGHIVLRDVVVLSRRGEPSRLTMPELRVLPEDVAVVGQLSHDPGPSSAEGGVLIEKQPYRIVLLTRSHLIDGEVFIQAGGSVMAFVDATDPKFIPMTDVRVRWISDRRLAARYPFGLVQRSQIIGVATEGMKLGGADETLRRVAMLGAQAKGAQDADGLGGDVGAAGDAEDAEEL
jgi:hypothetical protein